jgi:branched-chain amino acid transport system ATP-binding protein
MMGAFIRKDTEAIKSDSEDILDLFPVLKAKRNKKAGFLSGGEARMLEIARALILKPKLILLDEPSAGLAPKIVDSTLEHLMKLKEEGITLVVVEQKIQAIFNVADYGFVFGIGELKNQGDVSKLKREEKLERIYFA